MLSLALVFFIASSALVELQLVFALHLIACLSRCPFTW